MKRFLAFLLVACTLLLAACGGNAGTGSEVTEGTDTSSGEVSEDGSSDPYVIEGDPNSFRHTTVSVGKPYTSNVEPVNVYDDLFDQQLTDGQKAWDTGVHYTDVRMVGYTSNTVFTIDLGEDGNRISGVSVRSLDMDKDGVKLAASYRVYGSADGTTGWKSLGKAAFTATGSQTVSTATVHFDKLYNYRYIRVSVALQGAFFFIDEIEVYADVDEKEPSADAAETLYQSGKTDSNAWKALSTGVTTAPVYSQNVALNKSYTFDGCVFDERAPQSDTYLTDGARTGRLFGEDVWVGVQAEGTPSVTVDLGKTYENLYGFRAYMLGSGLDVSLPGAVDVYGSADGKSYTLLGRVYAPDDCDTHAYTLLTAEYVKARYLKFEFLSGEGYFWAEEIEIYAGLSEEPKQELYPELNFPIVTEDEYWDSGDSDYKTSQNLLLGVIQQVASAEYEIPNEISTDPKPHTEWDSPVLTDGRNAGDLYCYGGQFFFASGGGAIDFFYDIGKLSTVESLHISLLEQTDWGISRPKYISVFLSDDGETWYEVYAYARSADETLNVNATLLSFDCELETPYAARFVRFRIEAAMIFIDEFSAIGTKQVKSSTARLADSDIVPVIYFTNPERVQYANSQNTTVRANDILCAYGNAGDAEMLKAYVAYLDEDGNTAGTLFDGFLMGTAGGVPSNSEVHLENYKQDWEYNFDTIFNGASGLDVLEQVVGEVKEELNIPDYKVYVYITMWVVSDTVTNFGDVDGDGVSENLTTAEGREKVVDWFTSMCMDEFAARGYEHIVLDGFYWHGESVNWEKDNSALIKECTGYLSDTGLNVLWIPYYTANRYHLGYELGFDLVCMQPNYMFDLEKPLYRFGVTASRTERQNMCVEIEHSYQALSDPLFARNYMLYLYYGVEYGYIDATHIYYADLTNYSVMAYSDDPMQRMQYDATYQFINGTLDVYPDVKATVKATAKRDTMLESELNTDGSLSLYTLASAPAHGSVTVASDGTFRYFPDEGYTGTDSFTYTYNHYLGESEPCTVEITVE